MKELKDGIRALVRLDFQGKVHKTFRGSGIEQRYTNEVYVLKILEERGCPYVPRLLEEHPDEFRIVTTSCGSPAPEMSEKKVKSLFHALEHDYGVRHDDPEVRNITYSPQMGRFCLIDFELATVLPLSAESDEEPSGVWQLRFVPLTERGRKHEANDDSFLALNVSPIGVDPYTETGELLLEPNHALFAVSDGMGGQNAGELASRLTLTWVKRHAAHVFNVFSKGGDSPKVLTQLIQGAHDGLCKLAKEDARTSNMGATLTLAYITPGHLHYAHIGDSRLYLWRDNKLTQVTSDHTTAFDQMKRGEISETVYRSHPRKSALYRALGGQEGKVHPEIGSLELKPGDQILLCSDGLIDGLADAKIAYLLKANEDLLGQAQALRDVSIENDSADDTTLILLKADLL